MASDIRFKLELHVMLEVNGPMTSRFQITGIFNATSMQQKSGPPIGNPDVSTRAYRLKIWLT
jgi:hypothetical protein